MVMLDARREKRLTERNEKLLELEKVNKNNHKKHHKERKYGAYKIIIFY